VARPDAARAARWRRIAVEAARQCGRGDAPAIAPPASFDDAVAAEPADALKICMDPTAALPIAVALREDVGAPVVILVGPEGGLTVGEMGRAVAVGFARVTLGPLVLRTETVCAAVLGALLAWPHR
jgi:16S rRNA (uracil1498-N3)-methyltransferase